MLVFIYLEVLFNLDATHDGRKGSIELGVESKTEILRECSIQAKLDLGYSKDN